MPLIFVSGIIQKTYVAGQDPSPTDNSFSLLLDDGSMHEESIYDYIEEKDRKLFRIGSKVQIVYAHDELKRGTVNGGKTYLDIVLEMAVSLEPAK